MLQSVIAQAVYLGIKWHLTILARHQSGSVICSAVSDLMMSSIPYQSGSRSALFQVRRFMASAHLFLLLKEVRRKNLKHLEQSMTLWINLSVFCHNFKSDSNVKKSLEHTRAVGTGVGTGIFTQRAVLLQLVWGTGLMDRYRL